MENYIDRASQLPGLLWSKADPAINLCCALDHRQRLIQSLQHAIDFRTFNC